MGERRYIILLGMPGVGKGTQAGSLAAWLGIPHISSGDLFRDNLSRGTELGRQAKQYMDRGELVPDEITVGMVIARLAEPDAVKGALLDGFPRTVAQAEALERALAQQGETVSAVPLINARPEVALARLAGRWTCRQCGTVFHAVFNPPHEAGKCDACGGELYQRADDTPEVHQRRIQVYLDQTAPLIAFYQERGLLKMVDGEQSIEDVQADLRVAVG